MASHTVTSLKTNNVDEKDITARSTIRPFLQVTPVLHTVTLTECEPVADQSCVRMVFAQDSDAV